MACLPKYFCCCLDLANEFNAENRISLQLILYTFQQVNMSTFSACTPLMESNTDKHKKYSLKGRHQKRNHHKSDNYSAFLSPLEEGKKQVQSRSGREKGDPKKDLSLLASTFSDNSTFNCVQNVQNTLEFNRVASVKVIKTQNCIEQPSNPILMLKNPSKATLFSKKKEKLTIQFQHINYDFGSTTDPSIIMKNSQNSSFKIKNFADIQKFREENKVQPWKPNRSKFSLRKSTTLSSTRSQFRVCLCYSDIKFSLRPLRNQQRYEMLQNRQNLQKHQNQSKFTRFLCGQFRFGRQGCACEPKCHWINRWLNRAQYEEIKNGQNVIPLKDWEATMTQIEKDIPRTQVNNGTFKLDEYKQRLKEVLVGYCKIDWETGYVQGMNVVASIIVYHSSTTYEALKVFQLLMRQMSLRQVYASDLSFGFEIATSLIAELKRLAFDLYSHLSTEGVDIKMFVTSWYLSLLGAFIPLEWMHCIIQKFMRRGWSGINEVILALLLYFKEQLLTRDTIQIMELLSCRDLQKRAQKIDWYELVTRSDNIMLPPLRF